MADALAVPPVREGRSDRRVGMAVVVGTALEWFDFYLYASMAALVFGDVFFPGQDPAAGTLAAFATFAVGFLARPIGGVLFGALGDRIGRKRVLSWTFLLMGISSGLIGLIPNYATIGVAAPIALVVLRLLQGLGAGAEFGSAIAVAYEHAGAGSKGKLGSWPALGVNIGLLVSSLTVALVTSLSEGFVHSWGWRIPFLATFVLVWIGFWVRRRLPETPEFERTRQARERNSRPLRSLLRGDWRGLLVVMIVTVGYNGSSYVFKTFSLTYLKDFQGVAANVGALGVTFASVTAIAVVPVAGLLADRFSPGRVVAVGGVGVALLAFPLFWLFATQNTWAVWLAFVLSTGLVIPAVLAASGAFLAQQFPTQVRASGLGTGREVGGALAGGLAPLAALAMVQSSSTHSTTGVSILILVAGLLVAVGPRFDQSVSAGRRSSGAPTTGPGVGEGSVVSPMASSGPAASEPAIPRIQEVDRT